MSESFCRTCKDWFSGEPVECPKCKGKECHAVGLAKVHASAGGELLGISSLIGRPVYQVDDIALCVHPHERQAEMKRYADLGCPTEVTATGGIVYRSRQHKECVIALNRKHQHGYKPQSAGQAREKYERALRG